MAFVPTIMRANSMMRNIWRMPSCLSPISQPLAGCWSPNVISQVLDALRPICCSTFVAYTAWCSNGWPVVQSK
ncbi:hypothetical protein SCALM49S_10114 [Streptomyces californicus]